MANDRKYSGYRRLFLEVPAYSMGTFDFTSNPPNYFRVQNRGSSTVFCGTNNMPTQNVYDFEVPGKKAKLYSQPYVSNKLYVYNPSGSAVQIVCVSFHAEFDPLTLAFSDIEIEMPDNIESASIINGFNASLPRGDNHIGSVDVENLPNLSTFATLAKQNEILDRLSDMVGHLADLVLDKNKFVDHVSAWDGKDVSQNIELCNGGFILHMLTNDGETDFNVVFEGSGTTGTMTLKPGETIGDIRFIGKVSLTGDKYSYRVMCSYPF